MRPLISLVILFTLISCAATAPEPEIDPCELLLSADESNANEQQAQQMVIACLKYDSPDSDEFAEYLKVEFFQDSQLIAKLTKSEGNTLEFAKDWVKCQSDVFFSSKQDLIDVLEVGSEKYYESRSQRSMQAHCMCEDYLSSLKPDYKEFYDNPENRTCEKI